MREWYPYIDVMSCAQHVEAKRLANKYYTQWNNIVDRMCEMTAENSGFDFTDPVVARRHLGLADKADKLLLEWNNVRRGLMKCCAVN